MKNNVKKISFLSAIVIAVGSTVGAGIFFKNGTIFENVNGDLWFMIASWIVAIFGILAIGVALIEITSVSKGNGGVLSWVKRFAPKKFTQYSAAYLLLIYYPLNYFALPIYAVVSMVDAGMVVNAWGAIGIAFGIFIWISSLNFFSIKTGEKFQWLFTITKYIPLLILPLFAFIGFADGSTHASTYVEDQSASGLTSYSKWLGIFASIPAILFAFDGFYVSSNLRDNMKEPKKIGRVVFVSVLLIGISYLWYAISTGAAGSTSPNGLNNISEGIEIMVNAMIAIAVIGIVNGFSMSTPFIYEYVHTNENIGIMNLTKKIFKINNNRLASFVAPLAITILFYIILSPLLIYSGYIDLDSGPIDEVYGLMDMLDLITNFTSIFIFLFIGIAILGGLINRKTNIVKVEKHKFFVITAWISIIFIGIATIYMFIEQFANLFILEGSELKNAIIEFGVLIFTSAISTYPLFLRK